MIGKLAVSAANFAIDKPYSYLIPEGLQILPGQRVQVPFGRANKRCEAVVLAVEEGTGEKLKYIDCPLDAQPILDQEQLRLAAFLRERYFCTFYDAIRTMLPAGLWYRTKQVYYLTENRSWLEKPPRNADAVKILEFLQELGGQASEELLEARFPEPTVFEQSISYLLRKKWLKAQQNFQRKVRDKSEKIAQLAVTPEEALAYAQGRPKSAIMQKNVLELLATLGSVAVKELCYFTGAAPATVNRLEKLGYVRFSQRAVFRCREIQPAIIEGPVVLNEEQNRCFQGLRSQMEQEKPGIALLYGVTGSGKTSVYLKLIRAALDSGKAAMLLVPEIALTPQLLGLLVAHFGQEVAVLHSSLAATERYDQWKRLKNGEAKVVVGTRSAIFAPCTPAVIILDEEQEHSYKSENKPRYHAREIALWRGIKENALVLLGSATPSVESMYHAKNGEYTLYTLKNRYNGRPLPAVEIVDLRQELLYGNDSCISIPLRQAISENVEAKKQTILLLNRRGNSRALICVDCRETPSCPRCNLRLTYHSANERLMCHYCGYSQPRPERCPSCGGQLKTIGTGTQKVQQELQEFFPNMQTLRMDTDTINSVNTHEKILDTFQKQQIPLLIGTQMVAKGLNLPQVTLVGVLDGDMSLFTGGYRAGETTFNMLTQVIGRAGRGQDAGRAMIQTLLPEHQIIRLAAQQDYDGFYDLEIRVRRVQQVPPFGDVATVTFSGQEEHLVLKSAAKFRDSLLLCLSQSPYCQEKMMVLGPAPCVIPKINYHFRYQLTVKGRFQREQRQLLAYLLRQLSTDKQLRGVNAFADINGFE